MVNVRVPQGAQLLLSGTRSRRHARELGIAKPRIYLLEGEGAVGRLCVTAASCNTDLLGSFRQQPARQPSIESCCLGTVKRCNQHGRYSRIVCHAAQALPSAEDEPPSNLEDVLGEVDSSGSYDETGASVMAMMSLSMAFCSLQRVTVPVLAVPVFVTQFGYSPAMMGMLQSAVLVGYLLGQLPSGVLSDRKGGDRVMLVGLIFWSLSCAVLPLATYATQPLPWLIAARFAMGLSSACLLPAFASAAARWVPISHRTRALTSGYSSFHLGTVLGYVLTPVVAASLGWKQVFVLYGALGILAGLYGLRALPSRPPVLQQAPAVKSPWQSHQQHGIKGCKVGGRWEDGIRVARRKRRWATLLQLLVLIWTHCAVAWGFFILQSWTPTFMASLGFDPKFMGLVSGLPWLVCAVMTVNSGAVADMMLERGMSRPSVRKLMQTIATLGPAACLLPLVLPGLALGAAAKVACITGVLVLQAFSYAGFQAYVQDVAPQDAGKIISITNSFGILTGVVGNMTTGFILEKTNDYGMVFLLTALIYLSSLFSWVAVMHGKRLQISDIVA